MVRSVTTTPTDTPPEAAALDLDEEDSIARLIMQHAGDQGGNWVFAKRAAERIRAARQHAKPQAPTDPLGEAVSDMLDVSGARGSYHALRYADAVKRVEDILAGRVDRGRLHPETGEPVGCPLPGACSCPAAPQGEPEPVARKRTSQFDQLFEKLPTFDPNWPDDLRAKWLRWAEAFALAARHAKPGATSPSAGEWHPIITAPRDGTPILIRRPESKFQAEEGWHVVRWDDDWWHVHDGKEDFMLRGAEPQLWKPLTTPAAGEQGGAVRTDLKEHILDRFGLHDSENGGAGSCAVEDRHPRLPGPPFPPAGGREVSPEQQAAVALLPCPFCVGGAEAEHLENGKWSVGCSDDTCIGYLSGTTFARRCEAVAAWNRRDALSTAEQTIASMTTVLGAERAGRLAAEARGAVPVGWVLVPREPTEVMLFKGNRAAGEPRKGYNDFRYPPVSLTRDAWTAMLAAAPPPPTEASGSAPDA